MLKKRSRSPSFWLIVAVLLFNSSAFSQEPDPQYLPNVGPSEPTYFCQTKVYEDYRNFDDAALDPPIDINPDLPIHEQGSVFEGVELVKLAPGTVTPSWECTDANSCYDHDMNYINPRGLALLWVPDGVDRDAPRVLFIHGGSWWWGSPWTGGYATFAAKLAKRLGMPVLSIDYTLVPLARFREILGQVGAALNYLARHEPLDLLAGDLETTNPASTAPPLFIIGDSSGGATAMSALLAQASRAGLPGAGDAVMSGGVFYSPWINLLSNSPTYLSNLYDVHEPGGYPLGDIAFGLGNVEDTVTGSQANAQDYMGNGSLRDPLANPFFAQPRWLQKLPPVAFHVGGAETLLSDSAIIATKIARRGGSVEFHQYDGMWHVFPMYEDGCGGGESVLLAQNSYKATRTFLNGIVSGGRFICSRTPCYYGHYEYPQGRDTAAGGSSFEQPRRSTKGNRKGQRKNANRRLTQ